MQQRLIKHMLGNDARLRHVRLIRVSPFGSLEQQRKQNACGQQHEWQPMRRLLRIATKEEGATLPRRGEDALAFARCAACGTWLGIPESFAIGVNGWLCAAEVAD